MKIHGHIFLLCALLGWATCGCAPDFNRTHRGDVLDDQVTTQRVQAALNRAGNRFKDIHVETKDGVVVLSGNVASEEIRTDAENIVRGLHREAEVKDNIQVPQ